MTQPPPSTPTPRKFLLTKRPPLSQKTPGSAGPAFANSQRFQATPRFAPPSTNRPSTQRPPSTPGFPGSIRPSRHVDPIHDALESSPLEGPATVTRPRSTIAGTQRVKERIQIESDDESDSHDGEIPAPRATGFSVNDSIEAESEASSDVQSDLEERVPKRRRISVSSVPSWHDDAEDHFEGNPKEQDEVHEVAQEEEELPDANDRMLVDAEDVLMDEDPSLPEPNDGETTKTQPKFHQAPRFKIAETEGPRQEGLPEAFSPQRRGPKYIAGGLAAELQSWLAEVKGWSGGDRPADLVMRIIIDEISPGNRMYFVRGRRIIDDGEMREEIAARLMLAGEGRLTGLGQKAPVLVGSCVSISQPAWEVVLQSTRWLVACDWAVS
ncbi:unnamed protein product [Colletotrichum noveboracense]|uniref:Uncharacterized protein n=1 Tax=Colletotrichum noveboracense TaxID=2664923 RepID=A0A9W4S0K4_9PEZI|nr:hypothetical protein K456DRAFT_1724444 [Colletotrichum gloeosporioides 23]CAI0650810.1 unnamed protein product [Colletotrichum noveboracense]